jgi:transcriptional regulator with XRE-family HTH domain
VKNPDSRLSKLIRVKRVRSALKQQDLAELIGKSRSWVAQLENGRIEGVPKPDLLHRLSEALHIDDEQLLSAAGYDVPRSTEESNVITMTKKQAEAAVADTKKKVADVQQRLVSNHNETEATRRKLDDLEASRTVLLQKKAVGEDVESKLKALRPVAAELFGQLDELAAVRGYLSDSESMASKDQNTATEALVAIQVEEELAARAVNPGQMAESGQNAQLTTQTHSS